MFWHCWRCGRLIGELRDERLLIEHGSLVAVVSLPVQRRCICGQWNVLEQHASDSLPDSAEVRDALEVDSKAQASG